MDGRTTQVAYINEQWMSKSTTVEPVSIVTCISEQKNLEREREGLILVVHSPTLMKYCIIQVVTHIRTDIAPEHFSVGMVKKCCKDRLAFDSQYIGFRRTIMSYDRVLPSVEIFVCAQPSPDVAKRPTTRSVRSASSGWLRGYRRNESCSRRADSSQTRCTRCTTPVPGVYDCIGMR